MASPGRQSRFGPLPQPDGTCPAGGTTMLRVHAGRSSRYCDGMSRRSFVQIGAAGIASLGLADIDRARALGATSAHGGGGKNTSIILIWLDGGPSHLDMYDMKPDAPSEYRGIWSPIKTN